MTTEPKVSIIVVNWNGSADTIECIESLRGLSYRNYDIVVVDNGSTDDSVKLLKERFPDVSILDTGKNLGFPGGNNAGLGRAFANGAELAWLLNNDTTVDPQALTHLVRGLMSSNKVGMVGSKIYYFDKKNILWFAGAHTQWALGKNIMYGWGEEDRGQFDKNKEVDTLTGCSMLVSREVCEKIGYMDDSYFLYAEEVDWCARARRYGYKCVYMPQSIVYHKINSSTKDRWPMIFSYYNTRNMLKTVNKNFSFPKREIYIISIVMQRIWSAKKDLLRYSANKLFGAKKYLFNLSSMNGAVDFFLKRGGYKDPDTLLSSYNRLGPNITKAGAPKR